MATNATDPNATDSSNDLYQTMQTRMKAVQSGQADPGIDPFAASGGGVYMNGGWVPKSNPAAQAYLAQSSSGATAPSSGSAPGQANSVPGQAAAASTYSSTPGAAPTQATANQGTQDVVRNTWLQQASQGTAIDPNDPNIKQQVDPYAAAQTRAQRDADSAAAERLSAQGLGTSGAMDQERRYDSEQAGQATGQFQASLVGQELQNRRTEIQNALNGLSGTITNDQKNALEQELADMDNAIKQAGLAQSEQLGQEQLSNSLTLGTGQLNLGLMEALLNNQQFDNGQALNWANFNWNTSPLNPSNM